MKTRNSFFHSLLRIPPVRSTFAVSAVCVWVFTAGVAVHAENVASGRAVTDQSFRALCVSNQLTLSGSPFWTGKTSLFRSDSGPVRQGIHEGDPGWRRLQIVDPTVPSDSYTELYLRNVTASVKDRFAPDFESRRILTDFEDSLRAQNRLLLLGKNEAEHYRGHFAPANNPQKMKVYPSDDMSEVAGKLRSDTGTVVKLPLNELLQGASRFTPDPIVRIEGIPKEALPINGRMMGRHIWPDPRYIPLYLKQMKKIMSDIRQCEHCSRTKVVELLAQYYHTGINAHLFLRGNNSLLLAQVNYILKRIGVKGVYHASSGAYGQKLDSMALIYSFDKFKAYFIHQVVNENPGLWSEHELPGDR